MVVIGAAVVVAGPDVVVAGSSVVVSGSEVGSVLSFITISPLQHSNNKRDGRYT